MQSPDSTAAEQLTMDGSTLQFEGQHIRDRLVQALRFDLLGPESPNEVLSQSPATRYLVGMLAPQGTEMDPAEDDHGEAAGEQGDPGEPPAPVSLSLAPSAIGISFVAAPNPESLEATAAWGEYEKAERTSEVDPEDAKDIGRDEDPDATAKKKRKQYEWRRRQYSVKLALSPIESGRSAPVQIGSGIRVEWIARPVGDKWVISVFLVNDRKAPANKRPPDEMWIYQPQLRVSGTGAPFLARRIDKTSADPDPDVASADLMYRNRLEFATGHGVAIGWSPSADASRATEIWTEVVPEHKVAIVRPRGAEDLPPLDMGTLSTVQSGAEASAILRPVVAAYDAWIAERRVEAKSILPPDQSVANDHINLEERSRNRMLAGLELLQSDPHVLEAFRFANRAMAMQREASVRVLHLRRGEPIPTYIEKRWRPFQIGFILQCLKGISDPNSNERNIADLLWFPTAGGKTEAYLGLTAFAIAFRRLRKDLGDLDGSAGTSVLMRYTLRLLTIQQFQRATALICACEVIRRERPEVWGDSPFTIGLWVGQSVTPNSYEDSKGALEKLKKGEVVYEGSPYQVLFCPWCGTDITPRNYVSDDDCERTYVKCWNQACPFSATSSPFGLPVLVVDHEIYRHPPSLLLATVDKFAQMAWNGRIQSLFGRVRNYCPRHGFLSAGDKHEKQHKETRGWPQAVVRTVGRSLAPPDLIIQDELHLISGPLGTLVGIYETAIDGLCSRQVAGVRIRPKVVASTATIRRASSQVRNLFRRDVEVFPALGLDAADSFFAQEDRSVPGRLYLGIYAPGKSVKTALVRVYAAMLTRSQAEFQKHPSPEADTYMTLVGYFNSLRELGGAVRLVDDDVPGRIRVLRKRGFGPTRLIQEQKELTSRARTGDIAGTLKQLDRTFFKRQAGAYPIDVLLASNMLSVGVDIDRLGLMVVSAQPKTSAEYIQATSRVGRVHPGLVIEVYNWIRPRDTSHYERFGHYHDTFYRHVEATSVTPFSARARDRALPGVLVSYVRLDNPNLAQEAGANGFIPSEPGVQRIVDEIVERAEYVTEREDVHSETEQQLKNLVAEWGRWTSPPTDRPLVYSSRGLKATDTSKAVLLRPMEQEGGRGAWPAAGSLREVEPELDVILLDEEPRSQ
jgi:Helicase conserved C-terminal domain